MYCCGRKHLFFENGFQIKSFGNSSETCICNDGWVSIGFNSYPDECDEGATICTGYYDVYVVMWWTALVLLGLITLVRIKLVRKERTKARLEVFKVMADVFVLLMIFSNVSNDYQYDLGASEFGLLFFGHWVYFVGVYDRFVLLKALKYLQAKRGFEADRPARKRRKLFNMSEYQRALCDMSIAYVAICYSFELGNDLI